MKFIHSEGRRKATAWGTAAFEALTAPARFFRGASRGRGGAVTGLVTVFPGGAGRLGGCVGGAGPRRTARQARASLGGRGCRIVGRCCLTLGLRPDWGVASSDGEGGVGAGCSLALLLA